MPMPFLNRWSSRKSRPTIASSLRQTLLSVVVILTLLMTMTFTLLEYISFRQHVGNNYLTLANTLGINLTSRLTLLEAAEARAILATTQEIREIEGIFLFDRFNRPFVYYKHNKSFTKSAQPESVLSRSEIEEILVDGGEELRFQGTHLTIFAPIIQEGTKLGTLYLVISLRPFYARLGLWLIAALAIALLAIPLGYFLAEQLTLRIIRPVGQLAEQMATIARNKDFSVRTSLPEFGELHTLAGSFNTMLEQVEERDRSLAAINSNLETMVLQATEDLRASEIKYRTLFENSPVSLWEADFSSLLQHVHRLVQKGISDFHGYFRDFPGEISTCLAETRIGKVNRQTLDLFGLPADWQRENHLPTISTPELIAETCQAMARKCSSYRTEGRIRTESGNSLYLSLNWSVLPGCEDDYSKVVIAVEDLTARKDAELGLLASLRDKEILIREVHHRVKNNLQIITSLVRLQMKRFRDPAVISELQTMLDRVRSIALVHEKLYQASRQVPDLSAFVEELAHELHKAYLTGKQAVDIGIAVDIQRGNLPFDLLTSLVMILNELLTNAFKHAFDAGPGRVTVTLSQQDEVLLLTVTDNGRGMTTVARNSGSLGLTLVESLATQAGGAVNFTDPTSGTTVTVSLPLPRADH